MNIYKISKYIYFVFLLVFTFFLNQKMPGQLGLAEHLFLLLFPAIALQGISTYFEKTEHEFEKSFKKYFTRVWFLVIVLSCVLSLIQINHLDKVSFLWLAVPLALPFFGMALYIAFLPVIMLFDKKERKAVE